MVVAPRVALRTEAAMHIGFGHVRRCLSLATALRVMGVESVFLLDADDALVDLVEGSGFEASRIEAGNDPLETVRYCHRYGIGAVVVDSYSFRSDQFLELVKAGIVVTAIDDLADRELSVHLVVNGSAGAAQLAYRGMPRTRYLLGPDYVLLRPEFAETVSRVVSPQVKRILITVGGSDPYGLTWQLVQWVSEVAETISMDVVIGPMFSDSQPDGYTSRHVLERVGLHRNPGCIRDLMLASDLAICGGGQTTYELAATGTPAIAIRVADNQTGNLAALELAGVLVWAGDGMQSDLKDRVTEALTRTLQDPVQRTSLSEHGRRLVDGRGALRVASAIAALVE